MATEQPTSTPDPKADPKASKPEAKPAAPKKAVERVKDYVLVKHMARSRETRSLRSSRKGHRYHAVVLDTGRRIRRKGERMTEMPLTDLLANHQQILELVRVGELSVYSPDEELASYDDVKKLIQSLSKGKALDIGGIQPEKEMKGLHQELKPVDGQEDTKPADEGKPADTKPTDTTKPDIDLSTVLAASDQAEASKKGEANPPPSETATEGEAEVDTEDAEEGEAEGDAGAAEEKSYSEEELLAMSRKDLDRVAKREFEVKHPEKLGSKQEVVDAILKASEDTKE